MPESPAPTTRTSTCSMDIPVSLASRSGRCTLRRIAPCKRRGVVVCWQAVMQLRVGLLGAGSWGTTVAALVSPKAPTVIWARTSDVAQEINEQHTNGRYLPEVALPRPLRASDSIEE